MKNRKNRTLAAVLGIALLATAAAGAGLSSEWLSGESPAASAELVSAAVLSGETEAEKPFGQSAASVETPAAEPDSYASSAQTPVSSDGWLVRLKNAGAADSADKNPEEYKGMEPVTDDIWLIKDVQVLEALRADGKILLEEPNYEVELFDAGLGGDGETEVIAAGLEIAADEDSNGWGYESVGIPAARSAGLTGKGARVALIDSGVNRTGKLAGASILQGVNYITSSDDLYDRIGHGTIIAEILAGAADGSPVTGAAPDVEILPMKCFAAGKSTYLSTILTAARDAVDRYGCNILNMSWGMKDGTSESSQLLREFMAQADSRGVIAVAAAGNISSTGPAGTMYYPAGYDTVIGVGGVNKDLSIGSYSQQTGAVFVCAPGTGVKGGSDGTSFATPFVTAAAALLKQEDPEMTGGDFRNKLMQYAVDLGPKGYDTAYGYGFVKMDRLMNHPVMKIEEADSGNETGTAGFVISADPSLVWHGKTAGTQIVLAGYSGSGQMICRTVVPFAAEPRRVLLENCRQYRSVKAFVIDDSWKPTGDYLYYEP